MNTAYTDRTLALAGLFQAGRQAQQLAREGRAETAVLASSIQSLLLIDAPSTEAVFGGAQGVKLGLELLRSKLGGNTDANDVEIARYVIAMIQLEGQLRRHPDMQDAIRRGIRLERGQHGPSVHAGHHDIEGDDGRFEFFGQFQSAGAVPGR